MSDGRAERLDEGERVLDELGAELLDNFRPEDDVWPITAYSLAAHARSHHRALLAGLAGPSPRASQVHARPIVETAILIHYLAEQPDVRVWIWIADGLAKQLTMLREWLGAVERDENDYASVEQLTEMIEQKATERTRVEEKAKEVAAEPGQELEDVKLPTVKTQAERDPRLFGLYTIGFRPLSGNVHVAATLFTENRYGEAMTLLDDALDEETRLGVRALAGSVLALIYADTARALGRDDLVERTGAVHDAMMGLEPASPD